MRGPGDFHRSSATYCGKCYALAKLISRTCQRTAHPHTRFRTRLFFCISAVRTYWWPVTDRASPLAGTLLDPRRNNFCMCVLFGADLYAQLNDLWPLTRRGSRSPTGCAFWLRIRDYEECQTGTAEFIPHEPHRHEKKSC